jgi:hypothetical protein
VYLACPCFNLQDHFRLSTAIVNLRLGILDLGWVQLFESIKKTAKIMEKEGHLPLERRSAISPVKKSSSTQFADAPNK